MDPTSWPVLIAIAIGVFFVMEWVAWAAHKYIMHGFGWGWHKSHHEEHDELFEKNDLYAVVFSILAISLFVIAAFGHPVVGAIAVGITLYGLFYFIVHDGLVHQRWPFRHIPHKGYAKRLVQAHRLHHAGQGWLRLLRFPLRPAGGQAIGRIALPRHGRRGEGRPQGENGGCASGRMKRRRSRASKPGFVCDDCDRGHAASA